MTTELLKLPIRLHGRVKSELKSGEIIAWSGQPSTKKYMISGFECWPFFIIWTACSVFWIVGTADFKMPDFSQDSNLLPLFGIPFLIVGIVGLCTLLWLKLEARNIVYVITNQRAFSIEGSGSYLIRSYSPFQLTDVTRKDYADGSGDLMFLAYPDEKDDSGMKTGGFYKIPKVAEAAQLIEKLAGNIRSSLASVSYNEQLVSLQLKGSDKQEIAWNEIDLITISIEEDFLPFPYWYVGNQNNLLRIPNDALDGKELFLEGFSKFIDGYKSEVTFKAIIEASMATEGKFIIWKR